MARGCHLRNPWIPSHISTNSGCQGTHQVCLLCSQKGFEVMPCPTSRSVPGTIVLGHCSPFSVLQYAAGFRYSGEYVRPRPVAVPFRLYRSKAQSRYYWIILTSEAFGQLSNSTIQRTLLLVVQVLRKMDTIFLGNTGTLVSIDSGVTVSKAMKWK